MELTGAARPGTTGLYSPNQLHREDAEGMGVPFLPQTRPGKGPRGTRHGRPGGARRSSRNPVLEATKHRIGGTGRGRGARGVSPRLQTGRGRLGEDNRRGGADDAPVVPCCGSMA
jgi:hypothetical protein